jgi:hypothetical protein
LGRNAGIHERRSGPDWTGSVDWSSTVAYSACMPMGHVERLPNGSLHVRVYAGLDPTTRDEVSARTPTRPATCAPSSWPTVPPPHHPQLPAPR